MGTQLKILYQGQLPTSPTVLYTVPSVTEAIISRMTAINTSGGVETFNLWVDGSSDAHRILGPVPLQASGGRGEDNKGITLPDGSTIVGSASSTLAITLTIYGTEHT